eukprot:TRINITY_DN23985_c0_g1_i1.p1 TRINITY_DN23985_c0_g1~~TRINITY_DN23985_c0_g1_i1.p1  ORF type:complete len:529 (+),score=182.23 TRINITY_DN23985_c0_g1_i1:52-1638(+)
MAFLIDVGSDLFGTKCNVSLEFPARPSVTELTAACESNFDVRARAQRPAGYPDTPFKVETFQLFDETLLRWVDLYNEQQLRHGSQLWCFQPESIWHSDAQGVIPSAQRAPVTWTTPLGSPRRARIAADAGVPPTLSEKLRSVFFQIDGQNKGYLLYQDLEGTFTRCDMAFTQGTAGDLFTLADQNRSQHITYDEWVNFAVRCPSVVDALFFRMRDMTQDIPNSPPGYDAQKQRQQELQDYYKDSWSTPAKVQQEKDFRVAMEAEKRRADADSALREHQDALEKAQQAAQLHAQQHARARQIASDQTSAMDEAQNALLKAEQDAAAFANQEAAARQAAEQAKSQRAAAEAALRQAQDQHQAAQQQADSEAAAQYAAEQHAAQQQAAREQAARAAKLAAEEHAQALSAEKAQQDALAAAQATQAAQQAAQQAAHQQQQAEAAAQAALAAQQAREKDLANSPYPAAPAQTPYQPSPPTSAMDPRRDYESAKRRADELRQQKEDAEREEREAWNKLYYSPASPHYLSHSPQH